MYVNEHIRNKTNGSKGRRADLGVVGHVAEAALLRRGLLVDARGVWEVDVGPPDPAAARHSLPCGGPIRPEAGAFVPRGACVGPEMGPHGPKVPEGAPTGPPSTGGPPGAKRNASEGKRGPKKTTSPTGVRNLFAWMKTMIPNH